MIIANDQKKYDKIRECGWPITSKQLYENASKYYPNRVITTITSTPYNFSFDLVLYVRNVEDGTQLVEQILPYFAPDHTISMNLTGIQGDKVDVPIVLEGLSYDVAATGSPEETRVMTWTLTFTVQGWLYGFINDSVKVIRKSVLLYRNVHMF